MTDKITQAEALRLFAYDPETGIVTRRVKTGQNTKVGDALLTKKSDGYLWVQIKGKRYTVHRIIWLMVFGHWPNVIDHINGKRYDNRLVNLRDVTSAENSKNMKIGRNNTSGSVGVSWHKHARKWRARIGNGKQTDLGYFNSKTEAITARRRAEYELGFHPNHGRTAGEL